MDFPSSIALLKNQVNQVTSADCGMCKHKTYQIGQPTLCMKNKESVGIREKTTNHSILKRIPRPYKIVVKSSSTKIMSAASLDTSVPEQPIEMPISAFFKATASLTPSPVIPTTIPFCCSACKVMQFIKK